MSRVQALRNCLRAVRMPPAAAARRWGSTSKRIGTQLAQAGCITDPTTGAVTPPIHLSSTFERDEDLTYSRGFEYARHGSPTRATLEQAMAEIEGGAHGHAFASGMTAATSVLLALPNCYAVLPDDLYHGVYVAAESVFAAWGFRHKQVDMTRHEVSDAKCMRGWTRNNSSMQTGAGGDARVDRSCKHRCAARGGVGGNAVQSVRQNHGHRCGRTIRPKDRAFREAVRRVRQHVDDACADQAYRPR